MAKTYLWQEPVFPHFYHNPAVVELLEAAFGDAVAELDAMIAEKEVGFADVLTEV